MADILIRDVPDDVAKALTKQAQAADRTRGEYIRELLSELAKVRSDESVYQYISLEIDRIASAIETIQGQFQPWVEQGKSVARLQTAFAQPVQCLTLLLYIKSDMIHALDLLNKINDTLQKESE